ncbi:MAG: hypothetical protein NC120_12415 [Ruminococcus sp.]|nr:hypothetical protein [Ruminococcus sp.]
MQDFLAVNSKQLGICLKMLYAEKVRYSVKVVENNKGKINYIINAEVDNDTYKKLRERYRIMIS